MVGALSGILGLKIANTRVVALLNEFLNLFLVEQLRVDANL